MHTEYLQSLRYKLQKRIRRAKKTGFEMYISVLQQLWQFLDSEPAFVALQTELAARCPNAESVADSIIKGGLENAARQNLLDGPLSNEVDWAAVSMRVLRKFAEFDDSRVASRFVIPQSSTKYDDAVAAFTEFYLMPFYEYLDERLDDPQFILGRLIKFKHLCEWFWRNDLFRAWQASSRGEKTLAMKLYEFLFTEGIHIQIEPWSASGEEDMVSSQEGSERLIADAKVFNPDRGKSAAYIIQGFRQIYQYSADYNVAVGYLIIFNTSNKQLRFGVTGSAAPLPSVVLNHKTIFFLVIDLYEHEASASKRPQPEIVEIAEDEILGEKRQSSDSVVPAV